MRERNWRLASQGLIERLPSASESAGVRPDQNGEDDSKTGPHHKRQPGVLASIIFLGILSIMFAIIHVLYLEYLDMTISTCETGDRESCARKFETGCQPQYLPGTWSLGLYPENSTTPSLNHANLRLRLPSRGALETFYVLSQPYAADLLDLCLDLKFDTCSPQLAVTYYDDRRELIGSVIDDLEFYPRMKNRLCYSAANVLLQTQGVSRVKFRSVKALGFRVSQSCPRRRGAQFVHLSNLSFYPVQGPFISIHFDDGLLGIKDTALKAMIETRQGNATVAFTGMAATDHVHNGQPTLTVDDVLSLQAQGVEFTVHGAFHRKMGELRPADVFQEARDGVNMLDSIGVNEKGLAHFVYPFGSESLSSYLVVRRIFETARLMTSLRPVEVIRGADLHRLVGLEFDRHSLDRNLRLLDELADFGGGHLNAVFHGVIPDQDVAEYGPKHVTLSQFQKVLAHIQSRRLKIVTLSELLELSKCSPDLSSSQSASIN